MTFLDLFAGNGGIRRGMELAGHKCVGFCEIDKYAYMSYVSMHLLTDEQREYLSTLDFKARQKEILKDEYRNGEWYADDIRGIHAGDIPRADCWCFGFPCQSVSVAGKQEGLANRDKSGLYFEVMRILRETPEADRPRYLFVENVRNLLSVNRGWDFEAVLFEMDECGYDAQWQVLNSKDFGVPQNRERVFIIANLRNGRATEVFPIEGTDGQNNVEQIAHYARENRANPNPYRVYDKEGLSPSLTTMEGGGREPMTAIKVVGKNIHESGKTNFRSDVISADEVSGTIQATEYKEPTRVAIKVIENIEGHYPEKRGRIYSDEGLSPCEDATQHKEAAKVAIPVLTPDRAEKRQNGRRFKEDGEPSFTLTSEDRHGVAVEVDGEGKDKTGMAVTMPNGANAWAVYYPKGDCYVAIRKLTPKECFRLQGWTDEYFDRAVFVLSDSQLYKTAGNGVTVPVIYEIAKRLE